MTTATEAEAPTPCETLDLGDQSGQRFLTVHADIVKQLQDAVAPLELKLVPGAKAIDIAGDRTAMLVASRVLHSLCRARSPQAGPERTPAQLVDSAIMDVLRHEAVFRLRGLTRPVQPTSLRQVAYLQSLVSPHAELIIGVGPTGTGKTHLAVAAAVNQLADERVKYIVVTRPHMVMDGEVVTAGPRLELDYDEQFEYLEDIFCDFIGTQDFRRLVELRKLQLIPLGHFLVRSFNDAFIIIDGAQNMTISNMRRALTRMGRASRMVIAGDPEHVTLKGDEPSGLTHLMGLVNGTDIARVHHFAANHIVRNETVARIEELYRRDAALSSAPAAARPEYRRVATRLSA